MEENSNSTKRTRLVLEEWKTVIQTQMHFNDMIMRMRTTGVTIVLAFFGAAAISLQYGDMYLTICDFSFHASVLIITCGLIMLGGVFVLDYFYYYRMLLGAVERGYQIDRAYQDRKIDGTKMFGLSTEIRKAIGRPHLSKIFVLVFYGLVFALGTLFMMGILLGYAPT
jgi:hypothetical protein